MRRELLSGAWSFREAGADSWLPATVPGGVHTDLLAAGAIPDPFIGDNEKRVQWVGKRDWEYRRTFAVTPELLAEDNLDLVCDGLDTLAAVWLNGQLLGETDNMFCAYRWPVRDLLRRGENELRIQFRSPLRYTRSRYEQRPLPGVAEMLIPGGQYLRKAPYHFGWDWGPKLTAVGIWQDVYLEGWGMARFADVHLRQQHAAGQVTVSAQVTLDRQRREPLGLEIAITTPDGEVLRTQVDISDKPGAAAVTIQDPKLWWPNGHGAQPLYQVQVSLHAGQTELDTRFYQVGLRTLELRRQADEGGTSFTFVVNGRPLFCKGANWIPADSFATRVTPERLEPLIAAAAATHQNMLRCWGGGYYESEAFYDLCDRYGLLIWQDFMFACAAYPLQEEAFVAGIRPEVVQQVRRLRHRACLALWCGNNEIETAWFGWGWDTPANADVKAADEQFFYHTLAGWVAAEDPDRAYWPSSPSSGQPGVDPNSDATGDTHLWEVWHALQPFEHYRTRQSRFVSEFGFQALPALATVATYAEPSEWNMTSYIMEHHQKNAGGNGRIMSYLTAHFQLPKDFDSLVYVSQVLEAEALRVGVEHWRTLWPRTAGTLYWQLDDCWPVASWSSIDYFGRWKAAHYAARRFYAPLLLSAEIDGFAVGLAVHNDSPAPCAGSLRWSLETLQGAQVQAGDVPVSVDAFAVTRLPPLDLADQISDANSRDVVLVAELYADPEASPSAVCVVPFVPSKHLSLLDPQLSVQATVRGDQLSIAVTAQSLARFVELALAGVDAVFSDNYFDLPAGRTRVVSAPLPHGWTQQQARDALRMRSLFNSYA
jgi:beta-mannosidase